jgi:hypothetical protein
MCRYMHRKASLIWDGLGKKVLQPVTPVGCEELQPQSRHIQAAADPGSFETKVSFSETAITLSQREQ